MTLNKSFLQDLVAAPGPSSFESKPAEVWQRQAEHYGAKTYRDSYGNVFAHYNAGKKRKIMLAGHIDEIGLLISYIDEQGYLYFKGIGGWDSQQLVGQRVRVVGHGGELIGVIGKLPIHLMQDQDRKKVSRIEDMWIDIGAKSKDEALTHVRVGDFAVIEQPMIELLNGRLVSKAIDNRIGAYIVLEAARRAQDCSVEVVAVATVQEEISGIGAYVASHQLEPDVAIAVDVTHATDIPSINKKQAGDIPLAGGPELAVGSYVHRGVLNQLVTVAKTHDIPYGMAISPRVTSTDADDIAKNRSGVPTAIVSIPNRYMHSPNELIDLEDLEHVINLIHRYIESLDENSNFVQP